MNIFIWPSSPSDRLRKFDSFGGEYRSNLKAFDISVVPKINYGVSKIVIRAKDKVNKLDQTNVVYKIGCMDCNNSYVGQSKRSLGTRVGEHSRDSIKPLKNTPFFNQVFQEDHQFDFKNPDILDVEQDYFRRLTAESVHINTQINGINIKQDFEKMNSIYKPLFNRIKRAK